MSANSWTIAAARDALRKGEITATDLTMACLTAIDAGDALGAFVHKTPEIALEQADNNVPIVQFAPEQAAELQQTYALANALQDAIRQRQLQLFLQPKVNGEGQIKAFEALCRWQHQGQWIAPDLFIELALQHGCIKALSQLVLEMAIDILAQWQQQRC